MTTSILTGIFFCGVLVGCSEDTVSNFIPRTYVRSVRNEFGVGRDTLVIARKGREVFSINHYGIYRRINLGEVSSAKSFSEKWMAIFDKEKQVLIENKKGKIFSFDPSGNALFLGTSEYDKISEK